MKNLALLYSFLLLICCPAISLADDARDLYFQSAGERFFAYPQGARTVGMGGSTVMTSSDSSSVYGNPAGLGWMEGGEFSATYIRNTISGDEFPTGASVEQTSNAGTGSLAMPVGPATDGLPFYGNLGFAWHGVEGDWKDETYDTETERQQVVAAYAIPVSEALSLGYSLGWTEDKYQSDLIVNYPMHRGFRHTLGASYIASEDLLLGSTLVVGHGTHRALYKNSAGIDQRDRSEGLEVGFSFGGEYQLESTLLAAAVEYRYLDADGDTSVSIPANIVGGDEEGHIFNISAGVEQPITDWFTARAGYRFAGYDDYEWDRSELSSLDGSAYHNAFSLGTGFILPTEDISYVKALKLDYGVEFRTIADDWQHVVTLSVPFHPCA